MRGVDLTIESGDVVAIVGPSGAASRRSAFKGEGSPLRHGTAVASCLAGGHEMWWLVEAGSPDEALAQLPHFLAARATAIPITEVQIP